MSLLLLLKGGTGTTTPQTLTATVTSSATITKQVGKILTAPLPAAAATMTRSVGKTISVTLPAASGTIVKSVGKNVTGNATVTATIVRSIGKILSATVTSVATIVRRVGKILSATVTSLGVMTAGLLFLRALTATVTSTALIVRSVGKLVTGNATSTGSMVRSVGLHLTATATSVGSFIRSVGKFLTGNSTAAGVMAAARVVITNQALTANANATATLTATFVEGLHPVVCDTLTLTSIVCDTLTLSTPASSYASVVFSNGPRAWWRLGEASGNFADSSGNGHTAISTGGVTYSVAGAIADGSTAITLDGSTAYLTVPDHADFDLGDVFSLGCWIKHSGGILAADQTIFSKGTNGYQFYMYGAHGIALNKQDVSVIVQSTAASPANVWNRCIVTKDGAAVHLYINTVDVTGAVTNATIVDTATDLNIGRHTGGAANSYLNASIDEPDIYPYALTPAQVLVDYLAATTSILGLNSASDSSLNLTAQADDTLTLTPA